MAEALSPVPNANEEPKRPTECLNTDISAGFQPGSLHQAPTSTSPALAKETTIRPQAHQDSQDVVSRQEKAFLVAEQGPQGTQASAGHRTDLKHTEGQSTTSELPAQVPEANSEAQSSSLQPSTPPLASPVGASPTSRPASVTEGEESSGSRRSYYPCPDDIVEGIRAAMDSHLRSASSC